MKRPTAAAAGTATLLLAAVLTGCSDSTTAEGHGPTAAGASPSAPATVDTKSEGKFGSILVDDKGNTLYLFLADKKNKSNCTDACAKAWPPLLTKGAAKVGDGVNKKLLDITKRSNGDEQVTYNGHPLYYYAADTKPGQTNGQGLNQFGAEWYVLDTKGNKVES
ncbi:COG4315 family predicted lipoprotein [Streptomyces clavifer]|uniref:COG4315 family predicted lipoprotein n=1 Tax=Streptomyces clavifer TaxID=68188 RepID=UPI0033AD5D3D